MLDVLKELKEELKTVKESADSVDSVVKKVEDIEGALKELSSKIEDGDKVAEEIKSLKEEIEALGKERKTQFTEEKASKDLDKAVAKGKDLMLYAAITGESLKGLDEYKEVAATIEKAVKPADVVDWLETQFSDEILEAVELELKVGNLFNKITIPDGIAAINVPTKTGNLEAYLIAPATDAIESAVTDAKIELKTSKFKVLSIVADEVNQEAIKATLPLVKSELIKAIARAIDKSIILGDTDFSDANDVRKAYDGLLKIGRNASVDAGGNDLTYDNVLAARGKLGVLGANPDDLVILMNVDTYIKATGWDVFKTEDKYGKDATVRTGSIDKIGGIEVVVTEYLPQNLTTAGVDDGSGNTTAAIVLNKSSFLRATRGEAEVATDKNIVNDTQIFTNRVNVDFKDISGSQVGASAIINIKVG